MSYEDDELERMRLRRQMSREGGRRTDSGSRRNSGADAFHSGYSGPKGGSGSRGGNGSGRNMKQQKVNRGRRRGPDRKKRIMIIAAEILILLALVVGAGAWYLYDRTFGSFADVPFDEGKVANIDLTPEQIEGMKGYWNIACFGVDSRREKGSDELRVGKGTNADVNMICSINLESGEIRLVSVFRDTYLNISDKNSYNKINAAYAQGGPEQAVKALNKNLGLNITQYATFNWKAVADAINILGGVDIEVSKAEFSWINGYITETVKETGIYSTPLKKAGLNHMDGVQAVAYGRLRLGDTDFARTERQRIVLNAAFAKAKSADLKTLNTVVAAVMPQLASNIDPLDVLPMLKDIGKYHIGETAGFPSARGEMDIGKIGDCVIPQTLESNVKELHSFLFGEENYELPSNVKSYSAHISEVSGLYNAGKSIGHVPVDQGISASSYIKRQTEKAQEKAAKESEAKWAEELEKNQKTTEEDEESSEEGTDESDTGESGTDESGTGDETDWEWDDPDWGGDWNDGPGGTGPGSGPGSQGTRPSQTVRPGEKPTDDGGHAATGPGMTTSPTQPVKPGSQSTEDETAPGTVKPPSPGEDPDQDGTAGTDNVGKTNNSGRTNNSDKTDSSANAPSAPGPDVSPAPAGPGA